MLVRQIGWCDDNVPEKGIAWCAAVHGVTKPQIQLSDWTELMIIQAGIKALSFYILKRVEMGWGVARAYILKFWIQGLFSFSPSTVSDALWPHGLQHAGLPCPSASPGACSGSCALSQWCRQAFLLCCPLLLVPSVFYSIRVFPMSWLFISGGQRIGASVSVLPMNIQDWFPFELTGWISLQSKGL